MALAKNTILAIGDGADPEVFTQIANVITHTWGGRTFSTEDVTSNDSATPVKQTQTTVYDNGKVSIVISPWDPSNTQHIALKALSASGATNNFKMTQVASASTDTFAGFVTSFAFDTPTTGILKAKLDVTINGAFS